jgi:hypothetical protein
MTIYWSLASVPELASLSAARRDSLWRECRHATTKLAIGCATSAAIVFAALVFRFVFKSQGGTGLEALGEALFCSQIFLLFCLLVLPFVFQHINIARSLPEIRKRISGQCRFCKREVHPTPKKCSRCGHMVEIQRIELELPVEKVPRILVVRSNKPLPRRPFRLPNRKITSL